MRKTGVSELEPAFDHVHLQWFGDEGEAGGESEGDEGGETNVDDRIADLEKSLKNLQKDLSGKDRKITELLDKNKTLETRKSKQVEREKKRNELDDMSAEELKREIARRDEDLRAEYERELNEIKEQNRQSAYIQTVYRVAPEVDGLPPFVLKVMAESRYADEEEKVRELMEYATREISALINKNRLVLDNKSKTSFRPTMGNTEVSARIPTKKEWERMSELDQRAWAKRATTEQLGKVAQL